MVKAAHTVKQTSAKEKKDVNLNLIKYSPFV